MNDGIHVSAIEVVIFLAPTVFLLAVLLGTLLHLALRRPETQEIKRITTRLRNLEADHTADMAQIASFREEIFYLGRLISKLADIMEAAGLTLPEEVYEYLDRRHDVLSTAAFDPESIVLIQHALDQFFSLEELEQLSFEVGVDFDNLNGGRKGDKARALVLFMDRRGQVEVLIQAIKSMRPNLPLPWVGGRGPP